MPKVRRLVAPDQLAPSDAMTVKEMADEDNDVTTLSNQRAEDSKMAGSEGTLEWVRSHASQSRKDKD